MYETSKSIVRRSFDCRFAARYFKGDGIDIGAGQDSIGQYASQFPLMRSVRRWDIEDGDAMLMSGVPDQSFDFVHSSHCLEHLVDPYRGLENWIRICKIGGHAVIIIPDEDLYEQGVWPSTFNSDHKWTFTISKSSSWCQNSINVTDLIKPVLHQISVLKIELLDATFFYDTQRFDQTLTVIGESAIEIVLKRTV